MANWSHCLEQASLSDVGTQRANNQDSFVVALADSQADFGRRGHLFLVADGMGAHAAGELASKIAADVVSLAYRKQLDQRPADAIVSAIKTANEQIHRRGLASPDFRGMGTTTTALLLLPNGAMLAHVGDCRAYRWRDHRLDQLTFDHSLVWELRASQKDSGEEFPGYISKNIITRSLGPQPTVKIDIEGPHRVQIGDTFLLCSDGLSNQIHDDEMGLILGHLSPSEAVRLLVDLANWRGGPDNITVLVAKVLGPQVIVAEEAKEEDDAVPNVPETARPVPAVFLTIFGVALLAAIGLLFLGHPISAMIGMFVATIAAIAVLLSRYGGGTGSGHRRQGRGPYVTVDCGPSPDLLGRLSDMLHQLKETAVQEDWRVDWGRFSAFMERASAATQADNLAEATGESLQALMFIMDGFRQHRSVATGDSGIVPL